MNKEAQTRLFYGLIFMVLFILFSVNFLSAGSVGLIENSTWQGNLTNKSGGASAWADIDNDGDLDLVIGGISITEGIEDTKIYINNGTNLIEDENWQNDIIIHNGSLAWGDVDNDGDLDLVIAGINTTESMADTKLYINNGTALVENETWQNNLTKLDDLSILAWGDVDNDGDLDLFLTGNPGAAKIYINNGTNLIENETWGESLPTIVGSGDAWSFGDIDNDGDLDLLSSRSGGIYINNGTVFALDSIWSQNMSEFANRPSSAFGDIDNDGDLDLILSGYTGTWVYTNNDTVLVRNTSWDNNLESLYQSSLSFGDYDNDGDLDLILCGYSGSARKTKVYENNGTAFVEDPIAQANLTIVGIKDSTIWGDVDNDGDLDLFLSGCDDNGCAINKIYINNITTPNTVPTPPNSFSSSYNNKEVKIGWLNGSDAETSVNGLYYNLMIGTSATNNTIISGVYGGSDRPPAGYFGNMMQRKNFTLKVDRLSPSTTYTWFVQTIDTTLKAGDWSAVQSFTTPADMTDPIITLNTPVEYYNSSSFTITFNATISDANITNVSLWGNWTGGGWHLNDSNSSGFNDTEYIFIKDLTDEGDGIYLWKIEALDNETNTVNSSIRTFVIDSVNPDLNITSPANNTNSTDTGLDIEYIVSDIYLKECWYSNDTYSENISLSCGTNITTITWAQGEHNVTIWANDSAGNINNSYVAFTIDTLKPDVNITSPENNTYQSNNTIQINYTVSDANLDVCWYSNDTMSVNTSLGCGTNITTITWTEGEHNVTIWANDSANNVNWSVINFTIDSTNPTISISSPTNNTYQTDEGLDIEYEFTEVNPDSCWYSNDTMSANTSLASCGTNITDVTWSEGEHNVTIWIKDSVGNEVLDYVNFTVDSLNPNVNITYPMNDTNYAINTISVNYTVSDINLQSCWYSNDSYSENITWSCGTNITNVTWAEGLHNVTIWANDSFGNVNKSVIIFRIDTLIPDVNITSPQNNSNSSSMFLDIKYTLGDANLQSCWYSNDTYSENTSISCGTNITTIVWTTDDHNITIWVNDTTGNENSSLVFFTIDNVRPIVNITSPLNEINSTDNELDIEYVISDATLQSCWYSNDTYSGNTSINCETNITAITWAEGWHNLTIYANDSVNNENSNSVSFTIDTEDPIVNLISPADGSTWSSSSTVTFSYNVSDVDIANCSLIINDALDQTNTTITEDTTQTFTKSLSNAVYIWYVNCSDYVGYTNGSMSSSLTVSYSVNDGGSSGGGGGSSIITSFWTKTKIIIDEEFSEGVEKELSNKERVKIQVSGVDHYIGIVDITNLTATINISSNPITIVLSIGEEKKVDVTSNGIYDVYVLLNNISSNKANLTIKSIHEEISVINESVKDSEEISSEEKIETETPKSEEEIMRFNRTWIYISIGIVDLVLLIIVIKLLTKLKKYRWRIKKKKENGSNKNR